MKFNLFYKTIQILKTLKITRNAKFFLIGLLLFFLVVFIVLPSWLGFSYKEGLTPSQQTQRTALQKMAKNNNWDEKWTNYNLSNFDLWVIKDNKSGNGKGTYDRSINHGGFPTPTPASKSKADAKIEMNKSGAAGKQNQQAVFNKNNDATSKAAVDAQNKKDQEYKNSPEYKKNEADKKKKEKDETNRKRKEDEAIALVKSQRAAVAGQNKNTTSDEQYYLDKGLTQITALNQAPKVYT